MATTNKDIYAVTPEDKSEDPEFWAGWVKDAFEQARNHREQRVERQWFMNYCYKKGLKVQFDTRTRRIVANSDPNEDFRVNKIRSITRAVTNYVTSLRMRWDVDSRPYGQLNPEVAGYLGDYLDYKFEKLNIEAAQLE